MPTITLDGPPIKDLDKKRKLVKGLTESASEAHGLAKEKFAVLIKENLEENEQNLFPEFLYKYRCWTDALHKRLLTDGEIYFSSAKNFNDPFDSTIPVRYDKASKKEIRELHFKQISEENPNLIRRERKKLTHKKLEEGLYKNPDHLKWFYETQQKIRFEKFGIFSLTEVNDSIIMWSHYADSHKGFCVGFNTDNLILFRKNDLLRIELVIDLKPVEYHKIFPFFNAFNLDMEEIATKSLITKSQDWSYEKEYRLILFENTNRKINLKDGIISKVLLGCRMPEEDKEEIKKILKEKKANIELLQAAIKKESFGLDFKKIDY